MSSLVARFLHWIAEIFGVDPLAFLALLIAIWATFEMGRNIPRWGSIDSLRKGNILTLVFVAVLLIILSIFNYLKPLP